MDRPVESDPWTGQWSRHGGRYFHTDHDKPGLSRTFPLSVMAGRVPATHAPAVVPPPQRPHRPGVGGRDTPGHDGLAQIRLPRTLILMPCPNLVITIGRRQLASHP